MSERMMRRIGCGFNQPRIVGVERTDWRSAYAMAARLVRQPWLAPRGLREPLWGTSLTTAVAIMRRE
jgi:hypothetical protein